MSEHDEQKALFDWANVMIARGTVPELENMFAIPNGGWFRNAAIARKMKEEGLKKGVLDVFLAWPASGFHGLFIEMKFGKNKLEPEQRQWMERLISSGYAAQVCWSWVEAAGLIIVYLKKDLKDFPEFYGREGK